MTLLSGRDNFIASGTVSSGSSAANTIQRFWVTQSKALTEGGRYRISLSTLATASNTTVKVRSRESPMPTSGATMCELTRFNLGTGSNQPRMVLVQGWMTGNPSTSGSIASIDFSNDTAVNTARKYNVRIRIREY